MKSRITEDANSVSSVLKDIELDTILKSDFDKYVNWVMTTNSIPDSKKWEAFDNLVSDLVEQGKDLKQAKALAKKEIFVMTTYWRSPNEKEPAMKGKRGTGTPKENFPIWRKRSFDEEIDFKKSRYENSVLPLDTIREKEVERVGRYINERYSVQLLDIIEGRLTEDYYETARLIGKIDYLKSLHPVEKSKEVFPPVQLKREKSFTALPELFESPEILEKCLNVLRVLKVIDKSNKYQPQLKGVFVIWIKEMERRRIILHTNDEGYAEALSKYFSNFSISKNMFQQPHPKAEAKYGRDIRTMFAEIKTVN